MNLTVKFTAIPVITDRLLWKTKSYETISRFYFLSFFADVCSIDLTKLFSEVILGYSNEKANTSKELKIVLP